MTQLSPQLSPWSKKACSLLIFTTPMAHTT